MISAAMVLYTALAVGLLLRAEAGGAAIKRTTAKVLASAGFVALGALRYGGSTLDGLLLIALLLGAVGDVLLAGDSTFDLGLLAFLADHVLLIVAIHGALSLQYWPPLLLLPLAALAVLILRWLWSHLGRRKAPVCAYIAAITLMVWGALSGVAAGALPWWVGAAAVLFMLSDIAVARQRFIQTDFCNRAVGLPMYYAAQLLFALLIGR